MVATGCPLQGSAALRTQLIQLSDVIICGIRFDMRSKLPSHHEAQTNENMLYRTLDRWLTSAKTIKNAGCALGRSHDEQNISENGLEVPFGPENG
jgi:hypothetical protein